MSLIGPLHDRYVFARRTRVLASNLSEFIPPRARVLDVGCGDGLIDRMIMKQTGSSIEGIDTLIRPTTEITVRKFDGVTMPYSDQSFDVVMFVDVLHHTKDARVLLAEAGRVGQRVLIKDHLLQGLFAKETLKIMDWVGNARHGVVLPYNYLSVFEWNNAFHQVGLQILNMKTRLCLYPRPFSWVFERDLHFIALCGKACA
jgi:SAM-dependent methyltransferase